MKKILTLVAFCAVCISANAQNSLYFSPFGWWGNGSLETFRVSLQNPGVDTVYYSMDTVAGHPGVFTCELPGTEYTVLQFLRCNKADIATVWNKTGEMEFDYSEGDHWAMNVECNNGVDDKRNFTVTTGIDLLYFTPTYGGNDWEQFNDSGAAMQSFNVALLSETDTAILFLNPKAGYSHVYYTYIPSTNYNIIRFYRVQVDELIDSLHWGWNKTGEMPFDYSKGDYWTQKETNWNMGTSAADTQYFEVSTFDPNMILDSSVYTIRFRQSEGDWEHIYIYVWGGTSGTIFGGWPGVTSEINEDGWYEVTTPPGTTVGNVIFNNNAGAQFNADNVTSKDACYILNTVSGTAIEVDCSWQPGEETAIENLFYTNRNVVGVSPNPVTSTLTVAADNIKSASVFTINGKKIMTVSNQNVINVANLSAGIYFIEILQQDGIVRTAKFIKK